MAKYNIFCTVHGLIGAITENHPLYDRCVQREKEGYRDALRIQGGEYCSLCGDEERKKAHLASLTRCQQDRSMLMHVNREPVVAPLPQGMDRDR